MKTLVVGCVLCSLVAVCPSDAAKCLRNVVSLEVVDSLLKRLCRNCRVKEKRIINLKVKIGRGGQGLEGVGRGGQRVVIN